MMYRISEDKPKLKTKIGVSPLLEDENDKKSVTFSDKEKANILQKHFGRLFTNEPDGDIPILPSKTHTFIANLHLTSYMVKQTIIFMNINKSCGPDDIHFRVLKELVDIMSNPIAVLLYRSIEESAIPNEWKKAIVPFIKRVQ